MNRLFRTLPILLAASLQIMPLVRNLFINPATGSSFAFILRWGIGTAATVGAYDACSGASTVYYTTPSNYTGTVSSYFTNNVAITNNGGDSGAYFFLTNKLGDVSPVLSKGMTTTNCMPPGLTFKCYDLNTGGSPKPVYGAIYGTPTTPITNLFIHVVAAFQALTPAETNIYITILPAGSSSPPVITNHPAAMTNVAGGMATFSVTAGGGTPLSYQWVFNTNTPLLNATNASLILTNLRASQAGAYSVAITNSSGGTNSLQATLTVTNPPSPIIGSPAKNIGGLFQFTFVPVVGLTNSVQANGVVSGGAWNVFTNIPPPVSANPITITDPFGSSNRFYRVLILP
jgi:hypothetical protein